MDLFNFEYEYKHDEQADNFEHVQNDVSVLNTPPHPPYDDTDEYLNYVDGGDKLEKISMSEVKKNDFMSELTEFGFEHTAGDKPVVTARDAKGLKYKMTAEFDMPNLKDFLTELVAGNVEPPVVQEVLLRGFKSSS